MTSITFTILEFKLSTRSSAELEARGVSIEMAYLKSALEFPLIYHFLTVFYLIGVLGINYISALVLRC